MESRVPRLPPPLPVVAAGVAVAAALLGDAMLYAVMPSRPGDWGLSIALVGVLLSANRLIRLISNPLAGLLFGRLGVRIPFAAAMLLSVAVTATYGWTSAFWMLLLARVGWGLCWSVLRMGGQWTALDHATDRNRGWLIGSYSGIVRLGALGGALFGGLLTDAVGHRAALTLFAGATAAAGLVWWLAARPAPPPRARERRAALHDVLRDPRLLVISSCGLVVGLISSGLVYASLGFYFRGRFGEEIALAGVALGVASFTGIVFGIRGLIEVVVAPLAGHLSDRAGRVRGTVAGLVLGAAGLIVIAAGPTLPVVLAGVLLSFVASIAVLVQLVTAAGDLARPDRRAAVLATYETFQDMGAALGPLAALGWASIGALRVIFVLGALALLGVAIALRSVWNR